MDTGSEILQQVRVVHEGVARGRSGVEKDPVKVTETVNGQTILEGAYANGWDYALGLASLEA